MKKLFEQWQRFVNERLVSEEIDKADRKLAREVVKIAEGYTDLVYQWQQGELKIEDVAKEMSKVYLKELVQDAKENLFDRQQLELVTALLKKSPVFKKQRE